MLLDEREVVNTTGKPSGKAETAKQLLILKVSINKFSEKGFRSNNIANPVNNRDRLLLQ